MGGPGVSAYTCTVQCEQLIERLKEKAKSIDATPQMRADLFETISDVAELQVLATEARFEIERISDWAPSPAPVENAQADQLICAMSVAAADKGFRSLDTFVGWFVAGMGAAVALIIANLDKLQPYVVALDVKAITLRIVAAVALVVVAKFFGSLICATASGMDRMFEIIDSWEKRGWGMPNGPAIASARERAMPWVLRLYPRRMTSPTPIGLARRALFQLMVAGLSSLAAIGLVAWALYDIAMALV